MKVSYFAFSNGIQQMTSFLGQRNLPADKTAVIVDMDPSVQWVVMLGLRSLGLNTIAVRSVDQIGALGIKDCACVVTAENYPVSTEKLSKIAPGAQLIAIADKFFYDPPRDLLPIQEFKHQFGGHILYTSGTTGVYKKIMFDGAHEAKRNHERSNAESFSQQTVLHSFNYGLWTGIGFRCPPAVWSNGGCVVMDRRVDMCKYLSSHGVNFAVITPQLLKKLLQSAGDTESRNNKLTLVVGGGFVSFDLAEQATRQLKADLWIQYGATEVLGPTLRSNYKSASDIFWLKPMLKERVQVVDENGEECAFGQEGELRIVLSELDGNCYVDDETTSAIFFRNGCFYPGDTATKREDGCIRILGRTADVINIQGNKVAVAPIEQSIQGLLGVDEVCVFSGLSDKGSEVLIIAVESQKELTKSDLNIVTSKFSQFTTVSVVTFKEFPRTQTGLNKVNRRALKNYISGEIDGQHI